VIQKSLPQLVVHAQHFVNLGDVLVSPAGDEPALHKIGLFTNEPNVEHAMEYQRHRLRANLLLRLQQNVA